MTAGTTFGGILQAALPSDEKTQEKEGKNKEKKEKAWEHLGEQGRGNPGRRAARSALTSGSWRL